MSRRGTSRANRRSGLGPVGPVLPPAPVLPTGAVFDFASNVGVTSAANVVSQWADPNHAAATLTVPGGQTGPTLSGKIQGFPQISWSTNALSAASFSPFTLGQARTVACVVSTADGGNNLCTPVSTSTATPTATFLIGGAGTNAHGFSWTDGVTNSDTYAGTDGTYVWTGAPMVVTYQVTPGSGVQMRINGHVVPGQSGTTQVEANATSLWLGHNSASANYPLVGNMPRALAYPRITNAADTDAIEDVLAYAYCTVGMNRWTSDSRNFVVFTSQGNAKAPNASTIVTTSATSLVLTAICSNAITTGNGNILTVLVDGVITQRYTIAPDGAAHANTLTLDGAAHTVEIWNGSASAACLNGCALVQIQDDTGRTTIHAAQVPTERTHVRGDSITVTGFGATSCFGMYARLRSGAVAWGGRVSFRGGSGNALWHDYNADDTFVTTATSDADMACEVATGGLVRVNVHVGLNDQQGGSTYWTSKTAFQAALTTYLNALVTQLTAKVPSGATWKVTVFGVGVTASDSSNNTSATPWNVIDLRAAQSAAVTAVGNANVKYVDMSVAFNGVAPHTTGQLADSLHPNDAGHAADAAFLSATRTAGY